MVSGSRRWLPRTAIDRIVRSTGARAGAGAAAGAAALAGAGGCAAGGVCASSGAAVPPRTVPTRSSAPARRLNFVPLEITRPRLLCNWCERRAPPPSPEFCPARTLLANQALKPFEYSVATKIIDRDEENEREDH